MTAKKRRKKARTDSTVHFGDSSTVCTVQCSEDKQLTLGHGFEGRKKQLRKHSIWQAHITYHVDYLLRPGSPRLDVGADEHVAVARLKRVDQLGQHGLLLQPRQQRWGTTCSKE